MINHLNTKANLSFQKNGSPYSNHFNDIYFDSESGYQQSEEVFIHGNDIPARLMAASETFTIAETGFGTGLNFLLTLQAYLKIQQEYDEYNNLAVKENLPKKELAKLNFISVEKFPLSRSQLATSLNALPQLNDLSQLLLEQYQEIDEEIVNDSQQSNNEFQLTFLDEKVSLKVIVGDATGSFSAMVASHSGLVDAWYLDGFSPAKNPDMWTEQLFTHIGRLSKPQANIATFTVAGFVKRHMQRVGFRVEKKSYLGNKKEILTGVFQQNPTSNKGYQHRPTITKPQHVSIIGGGIASACAALALTKKGVKVTLYCKDATPAQGGSSNAIGALYPLLHQQADDISLFYQQAFWHAKKTYNTVIDDGFNFPHQWCGLLEVAYKESLVKRQKKFSEHNTWPTKLIHEVSEQQASNIANLPLNYGGLFMPNAGWLAPQLAVKQIIAAAKATNRLTLVTHTKINSLKQKPEGGQSNWSLITNEGEIEAEVLIVCGGAEIIDLDWINQLPFSSVQGQVTSMKTNDDIKDLSTVICHKGYLTPNTKASVNGNIHCIGATFNKNSISTTATDKDDEFNLNMLRKCLPDLANKVNWTEEDIVRSKARLRCMTPDHMPMVGPMPDIQKHIETYPHLAKDKNWKYHQTAPVVKNLYLMMGFGARGLCSAPLAADILTADICGTPFPVDNNMLFNLSPNRFVIRDIVRRKI